MQNWRKFSAVLGTTSAKSSNLIRPNGSPVIGSVFKPRQSYAEAQQVKEIKSTSRDVNTGGEKSSRRRDEIEKRSVLLTTKCYIEEDSMSHMISIVYLVMVYKTHLQRVSRCGQLCGRHGFWSTRYNSTFTKSLDSERPRRPRLG